ncbi:membrane protein insertion efficiency factor YidD [uncultured Corynebacterium sp.]|uniref:membrane protein insertion efficiency factor YidD n=1 Tax=uncultured Corynebacterium sp. TaxID=159447 RepID=UPI002619DA6B|nr:membrane protein insertion efficiency factor YidD [uncultured Corynebacterium sp.]
MCATHSNAPHPGDGSRADGVGKHGDDGDTAPTRAHGPLARGAEKAILFYRARLSPAKGTGSCRFEPTCSAYGLEAVRRYGAIRGLWLTFLRIARCAPWHPGGWDPVPRTYPGLASWWRRMHG